MFSVLLVLTATLLTFRPKFGLKYDEVDSFAKGRTSAREEIAASFYRPFKSITVSRRIPFTMKSWQGRTRTPYHGNFLSSLATFIDANRENYRDRVQRVRPAMHSSRERDSSRVAFTNLLRFNVEQPRVAITTSGCYHHIRLLSRKPRYKGQTNERKSAVFKFGGARDTSTSHTEFL
jgi:hypothetical protein